MVEFYLDKEIEKGQLPLLAKFEQPSFEAVQRAIDKYNEQYKQSKYRLDEGVFIYKGKFYKIHARGGYDTRYGFNENAGSTIKDNKVKDGPYTIEILSNGTYVTKYSPEFIEKCREIKERADKINHANYTYEYSGKFIKDYDTREVLKEEGRILFTDKILPRIYE
jgi:hypothetical protein